MVIELAGPLDMLGLDASGFAQNFTDIAFIIAFAVIVLIFGGLLFMVYRNWKKFQQYRIIIYEKDSFGKVHQSWDNGGIFVDKLTKFKLLFLQKAKVGLRCDHVPFVPNPKGKRYVYLVKTGEKNYRFVKLEYRDEDITFTVGEEDFNWAENSWERQKKTFGKHDWLEKYGPYILFTLTIMIIMIILMKLFGQFGILKDVAQALQATAEALPQAYNGTMVLR